MLQEALFLCQSGDFLTAKNIYLGLIKLIPNNSEVLTNLGTIELQLGNFESGKRLLKKSISIEPNQPNAISNLGNVLLESGAYKEAIFYYDKAILLNSKHATAYYNRGKALCALEEFENAISSYNQAILVNPNFLMAYINLGCLLNKLRKYDEAIKNFSHVINHAPSSSEAYYNCGVSLENLQRYDEALINYDRAIQLKPDFAEAFYNRGILLNELKKYDQALVSLSSAILFKPEMNFILGTLIHTKMHLCDWIGYEQLLNKLISQIEKQAKVSTPFVISALEDDPQLQKKAAEIYIIEKHPISHELPKIKKYPKPKRIRVGYFSADFREHAVSYLTAELFELHNRSEFEIIAFSFGVDTHDSLRRRLVKSFDQFLDVKDKSDQEIAILAREMQIDIAVDLGGITAGSRTNIFALRAAPIQISYIGYLGTMGASYIDYIIADYTLIPKDRQHFYSEKIIYLPTYQVNDTKRHISERIFTRDELGLPSNGFVFCCFNNNYKITPPTFDGWMRVLDEVEGSVLWLLDSNETARTNLRNEAILRGVDASRIIFGGHLPSPEYIARYRVADLFLDTFPYNAGTTGSDALRVGLPILTLKGHSFASRVAASLLEAVDLPELITYTQDEYESFAVELAKNSDKLKEIKSKLLNNLPSSSLFNTKLFTMHIESGYREIYRLYQNDLSPDHIYI